MTPGDVPAIPCDVNAPVFPDGELRATYSPDGDGAARLAVDAQGRSEFGLPGVTPDVVKVTPLRLASEIDQVQYAALIQRRLRLYPPIRRSAQFLFACRLPRRLQTG